MDHIFGSIGGKLLELIVPPLVTIIGGLITGLLVRQFKRVGLELTEAQEAALKKLVTETIQAVEEKANRQPMTGDQKHDAAIAILHEQRPDVSTFELSHRIDSVLPEVRAKLRTPIPWTPATIGIDLAPEPAK